MASALDGRQEMNVPPLRAPLSGGLNVGVSPLSSPCSPICRWLGVDIPPYSSRGIGGFILELQVSYGCKPCGVCRAVLRSGNIQGGLVCGGTENIGPALHSGVTGASKHVRGAVGRRRLTG